MSDSGFESRDSGKATTGAKYSSGQILQRNKLEDARRVRFEQLSKDRRRSSPPLFKKLTIPKKTFRNFSNLSGNKIRKKVVKMEKVTLQSIMART